MTDVVAAPAVNPWDVDAMTERALDVLRLDPADMDAARVGQAVAHACQAMDEMLDKVAPYASSAAIPEPLVGAVVNGGIEQYKRKDAPGGITDSWSADGTFLRLSADPYKGMRATAAMYRERWSVA